MADVVVAKMGDSLERSSPGSVDTPTSCESEGEEGGSGWGRLRGTVDRFRTVSPSNGMRLLRRKSLEKAIGGSSEDGRFWDRAGYERPDSFYKLAATDAKGTPFDFGSLAGKVVCCVNVATL